MTTRYVFSSGRGRRSFDSVARRPREAPSGANVPGHVQPTGTPGPFSRKGWPAQPHETGNSRILGLLDRWRRAAVRDRRRVEASGFFDLAWYIERYPEVLESGRDPLDHYLSQGWKRGQSPGPRFDTTRYLEHYRDVAISGFEPLGHYLRYGIAEKRRIYSVEGSLLDRFESLGDNCDFGMVQRKLGAEPLGLFRFAGISIGGLIEAIDSRLDILRSPERLAAEMVLEPTGHREVFVHIRPYQLVCHTWITVDQCDLDEVRAFELRRIALLARKFIDDLEDAGKILVFMSRETAPRAMIDRLVDSLRRFGPNTLLWVTPREPGRPAGTVERLREGLMRGYVDTFSLSAEDASPAGWKALCGNAYNLWRNRGVASAS
jgi:hypothetical protein